MGAADITVSDLQELCPIGKMGSKNTLVLWLERRQRRHIL